MRGTSGLGRKLEQIIKQMVYKFQRQEMVVIPVSKGLQRVNRAKPHFFFFCKSYSIRGWGLTDGFICIAANRFTRSLTTRIEKDGQVWAGCLVAI